MMQGPHDAVFDSLITLELNKILNMCVQRFGTLHMNFT